MTEKSDDSKRLHDDSIDYKQTVQALLTFAAFIVHDGSSKRADAEFGFGRRMTDPSNKELTPDLVAQKSPGYGIVAEAKKSLSQDRSQWKDCVAQLRRYDVNLLGWWTRQESIPLSNTILLIHHSRSRAFVLFLDGVKKNDESAVGPSTSVVEFSESHESDINIFFRLEYGGIKDEELEKKLTEGVPVPLDKVNHSFAHIRYYDARPPWPHLLTDLWTDFFPSLLPEADYDEELDAKRIRVTVDGTAEELQKAHGSGALFQDQRSSEFPQKSWIRIAFDKLVKYGLAMAPEPKTNEYTILYKGFREDVLQHFAKLEAGIADKKAKQEKQISLFPNEQKE